LWVLVIWAVKTFEITETIWRSDMELFGNVVKTFLELYFSHALFSQKIIAHLTMFVI